jgi:hypothetical protein
MFMKRSKSLLAAAALLGVGAAASSAGAVQTLSVPGVGNCVAVGGTGTLVHDWDGELNASTTQSMNLDCAPPWAGVDQWLGMVSVGYVDRSSAGDISCSMRALTVIGLTYFTGARITTPNQLLWRIPLSVDGTTEGVVAPYVSCSIPKASSSTEKAGVASLYLVGQ